MIHLRVPDARADMRGSGEVRRVRRDAPPVLPIDQNLEYGGRNARSMKDGLPWVDTDMRMVRYAWGGYAREG